MKYVTNAISGFPANLDLRYVENLRKNQKIEDKKMARHDLDQEFFKIKTKPRFVDVFPEYEMIIGGCSTCIGRRENIIYHNLLVNVLDPVQLQYLTDKHELHMPGNELCVDCTLNLAKNEDLITYMRDVRESCKNEKFKHNNKVITSVILSIWFKKAISTFTYAFSTFTFKFVRFFWYFLSNRFMQRLTVSSVEIENVRKVKDVCVPVAYILRKQSNWDWFFVLFTLFSCGLKPPVIMIERRSKFAWSWLMRKCGVIFIKPSKNNHSLKRSIYEEVKLTFIEENLRMCNHIMFYLDYENDSDEGEFILDCIIDSMRRNTIRDVIIIPTNLNYEKMTVQTETKSSFNIIWSTFVDILRRKTHNFGLARITFGQPFSLTGMIMAVGTREEIAPYDTTQMNYDPTTKLLMRKISNHIIYDFCRSEVLMSSNVVCFLLLKKFRRGIKLKDLATEMNEFCIRLKENEIRLGFHGETEDVINHVLHLLGDRLITVDTSNEIMLKPILELPQVLEISAYASFTFRQFLMDAVIMKSTSLSLNCDFEEMLRTNDKVYSFYENEMFEKAEKLCYLLQYEYSFEKPCRTLNVEMRNVFSKLVASGYFTRVEKMLTEEETWGHRFAKTYLDESDEDSDLDDYCPRTNRGDEYLVNHKYNESVVKDFMFFTSCLQPLIDTYFVNCDCLKMLVGKKMIDSVYYKKVINKMEDMLANKRLVYAESISVDILKNSMKLFQLSGVLESQIDDVRTYYLSKDFDNVQKIDEWSAKVKCL